MTPSMAARIRSSGGLSPDTGRHNPPWLLPGNLAIRFFFQIVLVVDDPQIQVGLGATRKVFECVFFSDRFDDGHVDRVVPVGDGIVLANVATQVQTHEVAMHGDVFEQSCVATTNREANVLVGAQFI